MRFIESAALNFGEAQGTNTVKDNANKLSISLKELKESRVNWRILDKVSYRESSRRSHLLDEVEQLIKIVAAIIKNKKRQV